MKHAVGVVHGGIRELSSGDELRSSRCEGMEADLWLWRSTAGVGTC